MRYRATGLSCGRKEQRSPSLQRCPGRAGLSAALKAPARLPAHMGCRAQLPANPWDFVPPPGRGRTSMLPASLDVGCCNPNCVRACERLSRIPWPNYLMETFPQVITASGHGFAGQTGWRAGVDGGSVGSARCHQSEVPRAMHPDWDALLEHQPSGTPHLPLVFCPGHSWPPLIAGPVSSATVVFWQIEFISSLMYERSSCFPWQPF